MAELKATLDAAAETRSHAVSAELEGRAATALEELRAELESARDAALAAQKAEAKEAVAAALAAQKLELEALASAAVAEARESADSAAEAAKFAAYEESASRVADAEQTALEHKTRLDGVVAQLESERAFAEKIRAESAAKVSAMEAATREANDAAEAKVRAAAAAANAKDAANAQLRAEIAAMQSALGATEEKRTEALVAANKEVEAVTRRLAEAREANEAVSSAAEAARAKIADLEAELLEADETRRALHNQIQELRGNVRVFARARPALNVASSRGGVGFSSDAGAGVPPRPLAVDAIDRDSISVVDRLGDAAVFNFDKVFGPASRQEEVFEEVSSLVQSALDGYKVCLFSYGQTGSGKTHTMLGAGDGEDRGIIPRAVEKVLEHAERLKKKGYEYVMEASYVEIYNEQIRVLLQPGADHDA